MRWLLFILSALTLFDGLLTYMAATTIMQQTAAIMILVLSGILFSGAAVVDAIMGLKQDIKKLTGPAEELEKLKDKIRTGQTRK